ncbi:MAG TPA: tetratricopeptide repeat protein [Pyrinomonadaceae bacterium]|nr:tetratricopeptide repeat protein [Pyrinomonadaceae bacterium]
MPRRLFNILRASLFALALVCVSAAAVRAQSEDELGEAAADPVRLFEKGQDAHAKGDLATALEFYEQAIKLRPDFPEAEFQRGSALVSLNRLPEAEKALRRAAELKKDWPLPHAALGFLLLRAGRDGDAEPHLRRAVELDAKNTQTLAALAQLRATAGAFDEARKLITRATANEDATAAHWALRGRIERGSNDRAAAAESFERALKLDPQSREALAGRDELRADETVNSDDPAVAVPALEEFVRRDPKNAAAHARLCELFRKTDSQKSLAHCRMAAELEPANASHATGYAAALVQARRFADAATILRRVVAADPDNYAAHANLATALDELEQYEEALAEYRWIARARPDIAVTHFLIARAYDLLGDYKLALEAYETFLARADAGLNQLEIEKVNLRLPSLRAQIKRGVKPRKK